jgi:hypothetical protein
MNYSMLRWWIVFCLVFIFSVYSYMEGWIGYLWSSDPTGITFVIIALFYIFTIFIGTLTYKSGDIYNPFTSSHYVRACWHVPEILMALGMMGTLIGFMIILGPALYGMDPSNIIAAKSAISEMASGMSTSVITTLAGLVAGQLIKIQLINLDLGLDDEE